MIGYLGPKNSFTYFAATTIKTKDKLVSYKNIYRLFEALNIDKVAGIVVPVENSIDGSITEVLDKLIQYDCYINQEIVKEINLALISNNSDIKNIKYVISNPHAHAECRNTLVGKLGKYTELTTASTSNAVKKLFKYDKSYAAIASKNAASKDQFVLLENINDSEFNSTRFIYVTKSYEVLKTDNKISIVCSSITNKPGALYEILKEFAIRSIDLAKIESRPRKSVLGEYLFFIDFYGNMKDANIKETMSIIKSKTNLLKLLGTYHSETK